MRGFFRMVVEGSASERMASERDTNPITVTVTDNSNHNNNNNMDDYVVRDRTEEDNNKNSNKNKKDDSVVRDRIEEATMTGICKKRPDNTISPRMLAKTIKIRDPPSMDRSSGNMPSTKMSSGNKPSTNVSSGNMPSTKMSSEKKPSKNVSSGNIPSTYGSISRGTPKARVASLLERRPYRSSVDMCPRHALKETEEGMAADRRIPPKIKTRSPPKLSAFEQWRQAQLTMTSSAA